MGNKGLKRYTKQISGTIGKVEYNVNINKNDANLNLEIPLIQTKGVNPISYSIIYNYQNYQNEEKTSIGKGFRGNYQLEIKDNEETIELKNPDRSIDEYIYEEGEYKSKTNTNKLIKTVEQVDGDSDIITYTLSDKYGNKMIFENETNPTRIEKNDQTKLYIGELSITNEYGAKIESQYENYKLTKLKYSQESASGNQSIEFERNDQEELIKIIYKTNETITNTISIEYDSSYIIVKEEDTKYSVKFKIEENRVVEILETYTTEYKTMYKITYDTNTNQTKVLYG